MIRWNQNSKAGENSSRRVVLGSKEKMSDAWNAVLTFIYKFIYKLTLK